MGWKKYLLAMVVTILTGLGFYVQAQTKSFVWDSNTEPDMKEYVLVVCMTTPCTLATAGATQTVVEHMSGLVSHSAPVASGLSGYAVVYARDKSGNLSLPSNELAFDTMAPNSPKNFRIQ